MDALQLIRSTSPLLNQVGAAHYFDPHMLARGKELGLGAFRFYLLGRGGMLGDVDSATVTSAFGYFSHAVVDKIWSSARETMGPREAATAVLEAAAEVGQAKFAEVDAAVLDGFNDAASTVIANHDPAGQALFAASAAMPVPEEARAQAMHQAIVLRELRGSAHLAAVVANGLSPVIAHAIKRPDMLEVFGYPEAPTITDEDRAKREAAEAMTDDMMIAAVSALSADQMTALDVGTTQMHAAVEA